MKLFSLILITGIIISYGSLFAQNSAGNLASEEPLVFSIWSDKAPGSEHLNLKEKIVERSSESLIKNRTISNIDSPSIQVYLPDNPNGSAILICPGGAYAYLAYDKEGVDIAKWFTSMGITAFILKYRLPAEGHLNRSNIPLMDAQRAFRLIRANTTIWGIDTSRIGVIGFSAGGHLASSLGTLYSKPVYEKTDDVDLVSARPDFMILVYPVISMKASVTHAVSKQKLIGDYPGEELINAYSTDQQVNSRTPKTFILLASDDKSVIPENSLLFYKALIAANVDTEIHIFEIGGHGFGIRDANGPLSNWTKLCEQWLEFHNLIR